MRSEARVVVIGGGVVGCSVLYHLTKLGWQRRRAARAGRADLGLDLARRGRHAHPQQRPQRRQAAGLHDPAVQGDRGDLGPVLRHPSDRRDHARRHARSASTSSRPPMPAAGCSGLESEFISLDEVKRRHPLIETRHFAGALFDPYEGHIDPSGVTHAYARSAQKGGAEINRFTPVTELHAHRRRRLAGGHAQGRDPGRDRGQRRRACGRARSAGWSGWSCRSSRWSTTI